MRALTDPLDVTAPHELSMATSTDAVRVGARVQADVGRHDHDQ